MGFLSGMFGNNKAKNAGITQAGQDLRNTGAKAQAWADQDRVRNDQNANKISSSYWDLYNGIGADGGGGGGGYVPEVYKNNFWNNMQAGGGDDKMMGDQFNNVRFGLNDTFKKATGQYGLYGEGGYNDALRQGAQGAAAAYGGAQRELGRAGILRGGASAGFGEQGRALLADKARAIAGNTLAGRTSLMKDIAAQQMEGAKANQAGEQTAMGWRTQGAGNVDAQEREAINARNAAAAANSRRGEDDIRTKLGILGEMRGLRGETGSELDYLRTAQTGYGGSGNQYASIPQDKGWLTGLLNAGAGIAGSFMTGGASSAVGAGMNAASAIAKKKPAAGYVEV